MYVTTVTTNGNAGVCSVAERRQTDSKMTDVFPTFQLLSVIQVQVTLGFNVIFVWVALPHILQMQGSKNKQLLPCQQHASDHLWFTVTAAVFPVTAGLVLYAHRPHFATRAHIEKLQFQKLS